MEKVAGLAFIIILFAAAAFAQTTAFNYQGSLTNSGSPSDGNYDFEFLLCDALSGGSQIGINALSAAYYPTASRATGVSWSNAVGRSSFDRLVDLSRRVLRAVDLRHQRSHQRTSPAATRSS